MSETESKCQQHGDINIETCRISAPSISCFFSAALFSSSFQETTESAACRWSACCDSSSDPAPPASVRATDPINIPSDPSTSSGSSDGERQEMESYAAYAHRKLSSTGTRLHEPTHEDITDSFHNGDDFIALSSDKDESSSSSASSGNGNDGKS